jgi:hypothetical protein
MSPTSYQAAPPRVIHTTRLVSVLQMSVLRDHLLLFRTNLRERSEPLEGISLPMPSTGSVLTNSVEVVGQRAAENFYQVLYGVPSNGEVRPELECTSTIPVVTWSGLITTLSNCGTQSLARVIGSTGISRRYPAC